MRPASVSKRCRQRTRALDAAARCPPAAAIVDLALSDSSGVDLCRRLREWSAIPLIVLSAIDEEHQKVGALNAGADDCVTKPFAPRELVARVRAALRRAQGDTWDQRIEVEGGLAVAFARRAVYRDGRDVHLTPIEFSLPGVLLCDRGRAHSHASLLRQIWDQAMGTTHTCCERTSRSCAASSRHRTFARCTASAIASRN